jgi:4-amino-4-deoxy-L-arabinose transferase-like glycosyltransferase
MQATLIRTRSRRRPADGAAPLARDELRVLIGLVILAAALRLPTLAEQSFWHDEAVTVGRVLQPSLGGTLRVDAASEATPPVYYVLAWVWTRLFGTTEFAVRSLSAVCGIALVPVLYAAGRRLLGARAGMIAAALAAVSPFLVWYSQEARAYALLALLAGLSLLCLARALERPTRGRLASWAIVAALALATHYFAVFLVVPEALLLLVATAGSLGARIAAVAGVGLAGAALLPLALHQARVHPDAWIGRIPLETRLGSTAKALVAGPSGSPSPLLYVAGAASLGVALVLLAVRSTYGERRRAAVPLALGGAALGIPLALTAVGVDYFFPRNLAPALAVLLLVPAAGFALARAGPIGTGAAVVLCTVNVAAAVAVSVDHKLQRPDWRGAAAAVGPGRAERALVVPFIGDDPMAYYLPGTKVANGPTAVSEVDVLGFHEGASARPHPPAPGFHEFEVRRVGQFTLVRFRGPHHTFRRVQLARSKIGREHAAVLVQPGRGG